jgi:hypothetical protein
MAFLTELWLPILVAAVLVFVASSIIHMGIPWHKNDYQKLPDEDAVMETVRAGVPAPGTYMFPRCESMKDMKNPEYRAKYERGPVGMLTVMPPGGFNMGKSLGAWFGYIVLVEVVVAYVAWHALGAGAEYLRVFQIAGASAVLGFGVLGVMCESIWKGQKWSVTGRFMVDGLVYALLSAGVFGWLWPAAAA